MKKINRRKTRILNVDGVKIGGNSPISVQSMTNTDTRDVRATARQIKELEKAGCEIIRVAVPDMESARAIRKIKSKINIPLVADIHFDYKLAIEAINQGADKIRINPGTIGDKEKIKAIVKAAKKKNIPVRIGVNSGSLEWDLLKKYKEKIEPGALVESALRSIRFLERLNFKDIIVSLKSSDVLTTIKAYEILAKKGDWPFHLGITEAGRARTGIVKSSIGIGSLLLKGIGDTIRVSLSGPPIEEVKVGWEILKNLGLRERGLTVISCPTCARTKIPVAEIARYLEGFSEKVKKPLKIAVIGCIVNGLGEARYADLAVVGMENKKAAIFKKGKFVKNIKPKELKPFLKRILCQKASFA
jgi:(E)-4-hydroxy-3-methylbut-2-enyl-diphosphate synthase